MRYLLEELPSFSRPVGADALATTVLQDLDSALAAVMQVDLSSLLADRQSAATCGIPENERPLAVSADNARFDLAAALRRRATSMPNDSFDFLFCMKVYIIMTRGSSYRDIHQFMANVRYRIICQQRYVALLFIL